MLPLQGATGRSLVGELKIPHAAQRGEIDKTKSFFFFKKESFDEFPLPSFPSLEKRQNSVTEA